MLAVYFFYAYLALGVIIGLSFVSIGVKKVDPGMARASLLTRLIILPGAIILWPVVLSKWIKSDV